MGKFKHYLLKEELGLGNLGQNIERIANNAWLGNAINGAFVNNDYNTSEMNPSLGSAGFDTIFPSTDLSIPSVQKQGRITNLLLKTNPIYIRLSDGTQAYFTYDEFKKIQGKPEIGKVMTITLQRHPKDASGQMSKIDSAKVID